MTTSNPIETRIRRRQDRYRLLRAADRPASENAILHSLASRPRTIRLTRQLVRFEARWLAVTRLARPKTPPVVSAALLRSCIEHQRQIEPDLIPEGHTSSEAALAILEDLIDRELLLSGPEESTYVVHPRLIRVCDLGDYSSGHTEYMDRAEATMRDWRRKRGKRRRPDEPPVTKGWPERERRLDPAVRAASAWMYEGRE